MKPVFIQVMEELLQLRASKIEKCLMSLSSRLELETGLKQLNDSQMGFTLEFPANHFTIVLENMT